MIELIDTNASAIAAEFVRARRSAGSPAMGMIMTLVIVAEGADADEAMEVAQSASREHPARILGVVFGDRPGAARSTPRSGIGSGASGERALIRLTGEVTRHAAVRGAAAAAARLPRRGVVAGQGARRTPPPTRSACWAPVGSPTPPRCPRSKAKAMLDPVHDVRPGQHRPGLDPDHRLAGAARRGPGPAPGQGAVRVGHRRARSAPAPTCCRPGSATGCGATSRRGNSDGPGITAVVLTTKQATSASPAPTAGWRPWPRPASRTGRWPSSAATSTSCCRRSCGASTPTTCTPPRPAGWPQVGVPPSRQEVHRADDPRRRPAA